MLSIVRRSRRPLDTAAASAGVALLVCGTVAWVVNRAPTGCGGEAQATDNGHEIHATKVIVEPWLGKHRVYGIFMVPDMYMDNSKYTAALNVAGRYRFPAAVWPRRQFIDDVAAAPGHYLLRSYVSTRTALWFLMTGRFGELQSCDWTLVFAERSPS
jgi:hypothetical protein